MSIIITKIKFLLLISLLMVNTYFSADDKALKKEVYGIVFLETMFYNVALNDASAAIKIYLNELQKNIPLDFSLKPVMFKDNNDMLRNHTKENLAIINFSATDYLMSKNSVQVTPIFVNTFKDSPYEEYLLLVKKENKVNKVNDLTNEEIGMVPRKNNSLLYMWLKVILSKNKVAAKDKILEKISEGKTDSQNIMAVFFGQLDACIVSKRAFQVMSELNPQVGKQLKILASSPGFIISVVCFTTKFMNSPHSINFYNQMLKVGSYPAGQQLFTLLKTDMIIPFKEEYLMGVKELINDYNMLEKKK